LETYQIAGLVAKEGNECMARGWDSALFRRME